MKGTYLACCMGCCMHPRCLPLHAWTMLSVSYTDCMNVIGLQATGLKVTDVVVLIDREQGGQARLASQGLTLHSAFPLSLILKVGMLILALQPSSFLYISEVCLTIVNAKQKSCPAMKHMLGLGRYC